MTKEEAIRTKYPFYDPIVYGKDIELNGEQVGELMDDWAAQQAIEFAKWVKENYKEPMPGEGYIDITSYYEVANLSQLPKLKIESLYQLFIQSKEETNGQDK